jgi:hypothetical protein
VPLASIFIMVRHANTMSCYIIQTSGLCIEYIHINSIHWFYSVLHRCKGLLPLYLLPWCKKRSKISTNNLLLDEIHQRIVPWPALKWFDHKYVVKRKSSSGRQALGGYFRTTGHEASFFWIGQTLRGRMGLAYGQDIAYLVGLWQEYLCGMTHEGVFGGLSWGCCHGDRLNHDFPLSWHANI